MNSPAAQGPSQTSWESVLWHEFTHVITLTKTKNRMPRWLSEGISVYEERLADSRWGQSMTPAFRQMILGDDLVPVSELSGAFLSPATPMHLQFAYFESSLVVEFLVDEFGLKAVLKVLEDLGDGVTINDALSRHTVDIDDLDRAFESHVRELAKAYASDADFEELTLPPDVDRATVEAVLSSRPNSLAALKRLAQIQLAERVPEDALTTVDRAIELFGDARPPIELLQLKADIQQRLGQTVSRLETLRQVVSVSSDDVDALRTLMERAEADDNMAAASDLADQLLAVNPLLEAPHHILASAAERRGDVNTAIGSLQALSVMDPADPAGLHYRIAALCRDANRWDEARRHVLLSLEEAPRYRDAHRLLLEVVAQRGNVERPVSPELARDAESVERPSSLAETPVKPPASEPNEEETE